VRYGTTDTGGAKLSTDGFCRCCCRCRCCCETHPLAVESSAFRLLLWRRSCICARESLLRWPNIIIFTTRKRNNGRVLSTELLEVKELKQEKGLNNNNCSSRSSVNWKRLPHLIMDAQFSLLFLGYDRNERKRNNNTAIRVHLNWKNDCRILLPRPERFFYCVTFLQLVCESRVIAKQKKIRSLLAKWWTEPPWTPSGYSYAFVRECPIAFQLWRVTWEKKRSIPTVLVTWCVSFTWFFYFLRAYIYKHATHQVGMYLKTWSCPFLLINFRSKTPLGSKLLLVDCPVTQVSKTN
jgi:hypothetical protein